MNTAIDIALRAIIETANDPATEVTDWFLGFLRGQVSICELLSNDVPLLIEARTAVLNLRKRLVVA